MAAAPSLTTLAAILALSSLTAFPATARDAALGALRISGAWIPLPAPGASTAAGYVGIANTGRAADRLLAGSTAMASATEIHLTSMAANISRMRPVQDGVPLPAGKIVFLRPGGYHFMFTGLRRPFRDGAHIVVQLKFAHAPPAKVEFVVERYAGRAATTSRMSMAERPM